MTVDIADQAYSGVENNEVKLDHDRTRIGDRLASSAILLWATTVFLRLLQVATTAILARLLNPSDYGVVAMATVIVGFLDVLSNLQVGGAIIKKTNLTPAYLNTAFTLNMIRGALSALAMVLLAKPLSIYMHDARLQDILYVLAFPAFIGGLHNPHFILYSRNLNFRQESQRDALASILGSVVGISTALIFHSYWALVASAVASGTLWTLFSYWRVPGKPRLGFKDSREILSYGTWLILINVLDFINNRVDYFLIGKKIGSSALGAYNIGQVLTMTATGDVVIALGRALFPAFSMLSDDIERLRSGYRQIQSITLALALPIGFGMSALAGNIVLVLVGRKWGMAIPVISILAPLIALQTMTASIESLALSMNKGQFLFWRTAIYFVVRVTAMFAGFYFAGFMGIIYARVIAGSFFLLYSLALAAKITKSGMFDPFVTSWRSFVSVALMWVVVREALYVDIWRLSFEHLLEWMFVRVIAGVVVYSGTHITLWFLTGRPDGAESILYYQCQRLLQKVASRVRPKAT